MLIPSRFSMIKVEALETSSGLKVGDHIIFGGYRRIDEKIEPVKSGTIIDIRYLCDAGISYYRLTVDLDPNPEHIHQIEGAESFFKVPAPTNDPTRALWHFLGWRSTTPSTDVWSQVDNFDDQYNLSKSIGDSRYGSACQHLRTRGGICLDCQRKVR